MDIPYGYCHCGCGEKTNIAKSNSKKKGWIKGQPKRYINHHGRRKFSPGGDWKTGYTVDDNGCWIWQRAVTDMGYGTIDVNGRSVLAHRHFYRMLKGPIPKNMVLDHLCKNPRCVNPDHLEIVTQQINIQRSRKAKLSPDNIARIKELLNDGLAQKDVATMFGVCSPHISRIKNSRRWGNY